MTTGKTRMNMFMARYLLMNNLVLQQLIHGYQDDQWIMQMGAPQHYDHTKSDLPMKNKREYFHRMSKRIQQAMKFYIDGRDQKNNLTPTEMEKVVEDLKIYLPYKSCFVQQETNEYVINLLVSDLGDKTEDTDQDVITATMIIYMKQGKYFAHDLTSYGYTYHDENQMSPYLKRLVNKSDYTYWIKACPEDRITTNPDSDGRYTNQSLEDWTARISEVIVQLNVLLTYPEITDSKDVLGRPNNTHGHTQIKNLKDSTLRTRPKYQHKTLKLNMYGEPSGGESKGKRSEGTAFHSVRKHIRKLASGKKTFVKAHFRGSKDIGVLTKDYEILS
jgi:hypothetical protein